MRLVEKNPSGLASRCAGVVPVIGAPSASREARAREEADLVPALRMLTSSRCRLSARCFSVVQLSAGERGTSGAAVTPAKKYLPFQRRWILAHCVASYGR